MILGSSIVMALAVVTGLAVAVVGWRVAERGTQVRLPSLMIAPVAVLLLGCMLMTAHLFTMHDVLESCPIWVTNRWSVWSRPETTLLYVSYLLAGALLLAGAWSAALSMRRGPRSHGRDSLGWFVLPLMIPALHVVTLLLPDISSLGTLEGLGAAAAMLLPVVVGMVAMALSCMRTSDEPEVRAALRAGRVRTVTLGVAGVGLLAAGWYGLAEPGFGAGYSMAEPWTPALVCGRAAAIISLITGLAVWTRGAGWRSLRGFAVASLGWGTVAMACWGVPSTLVAARGAHVKVYPGAMASIGVQTLPTVQPGQALDHGRGPYIVLLPDRFGVDDVTVSSVFERGSIAALVEAYELAVANGADCAARHGVPEFGVRPTSASLVVGTETPLSVVAAAMSRLSERVGVQRVELMVRQGDEPRAMQVWLGEVPKARTVHVVTHHSVQELVDATQQARAELRYGEALRWVFPPKN